MAAGQPFLLHFSFIFFYILLDSEYIYVGSLPMDQILNQIQGPSLLIINEENCSIFNITQNIVIAYNLSIE